MTPRKPTRSLLAIATGAAPRRGRGAASAVRLGASFEDTVAAVWALHGHAMRGQAVTKVVRSPQGPKVVHAKKNGVDLVGVLHGQAVALECKRLPGVASLRGSKDDSTAAEAAWLLAFANAGGRAAFLVYDPDRSRVYLIGALSQLASVAAYVPVQLRARDGRPAVPWFDAADLAHGVRVALRTIAL